MCPQLPLSFLAGSPGPMELMVIFAVVLVLFGPRKLPELARSLGRILSQLRNASEEFKSHIMSMDTFPANPASDDKPRRDTNASHESTSGKGSGPPLPAGDYPDETLICDKTASVKDKHGGSKDDDEPRANQQDSKATAG